ncbi:MAG: arginyltransferase [Janthinobacterium lividum]
MHILDHFVSGLDACHYLPDRLATQEYVAVAQISPDEYEALMNLGWRKFGRFLFHPTCGHCTECRPIRIAPDQFIPDRSQQRTWRKNADLRVQYAPPSVDPARLDLYCRYQANQSIDKGWPETERTSGSYARQFVHNPLPSVEISIWEADTLRAIVITDKTPNVVSGVYHFHDPDSRSRSLGTYAMLHTIELARRLEKRWAYFGYYVAGCGSMNYKIRFQPNEILGPEGVWRADAGIIET